MPLVLFSFFLFTFSFAGSAFAQTKPGWEAEWEKTIAAAKAEGQLNVYTFSGGSELIIHTGIFQKKFPGIKIITTSGDPVPRILAERRAGKYIADVVIGGASTPWDLYLAKALDPLKDAMILPEVLDESKWWSGKHGWIDEERRYAFPFLGNPQRGAIFYNTKLVRPDEFRSFWDFVNPKWKGKIVARDVRQAGQGTVVVRFFLHTPGLGGEYIRRLFSEMDVTLFRDRRQAVDWLASGKYPICFFCSSTDVGRAREQGLPVTEFGEMKEGVGITSSGGNLGLLNQAPNPNAAKLFVNWLLSREGQTAVQASYSDRGNPVNSRRIDIPKDRIPPEGRLREGVPYIEVEKADRMSMVLALKIFNEALAEAEKRRR
jgi:iron(III) transport system substrate-binding protein